MCDEQHGFRHKRSCETQLILTIHDLAKNLDSGLQSDVILLDFSKAFDKVDHKLLLHKLDHYGIRGSLLSWLGDFLTNRKQQVVIAGQQSLSDDVTSGVPQSSVLGPLLFLCFINDLPERIKCKVKLYADDVLLYTPINNIDDCHRLQNDLTTLEQWASKWNMVFNPTKCEFLRVSNKTNQISMQYFIQGQIIQEVSSVKYLGITIDQHLTWNTHVKQVTNKANKIKCFLQRNLKYCPTTIKVNCYKSLVRPVIEYAATVWAPYTQNNINAIEAVQRRAARFVYNNYSTYASVSNMITNLGWNTLHNRRNELRLILLFKIVHQLVDINTYDMLALCPSNYDTRGHHLRFFQVPTRINAFRHSFFPSTAKLWNTLSDDIVAITNVEIFKSKICI